MLPDNISSHEFGMFLSGVESDRYWDIVVKQGGIRNVLTTYYYFRKQKPDTLAKRFEETPDVRVFIDSGAYTFKEKGENLTIAKWEEYLEEYVQWARDNKDFIFAIANLDIEGIVGDDQVQKWNRKYFEPLEKEGIPVCYIWHPSSGDRLWTQYCKKYNYVGASSEIVNDFSESKLRKLLTVAKKHNTVVHGMAFTKTQLLVKHPMYTVDSTTWIVGQQYGELNWFDGRKMRRLKKKDWQRNYKTKLLKPPFNADWDLLMNGMGGKGDTYELLRLNVIAYKVAEEHIRKRLGRQQYWLKGGRKQVLTEKDDHKGVLPDREWFNGSMDNYADFAKNLNITTDAPKDEICAVLKDFYTFITQDEELLESFTEERLIENALHLADEEVDNAEDALEVLHDYYKANAEGDLDDFNESSDEDLSHLVGKERESYLEEDEFEEIEVTEQDVSNFTALPAPSDMEEVDEYDAELSLNGVAVKRGSSGQFLKGTRRIRKNKEVYSQKYPKLICNTCYKSGDCPEYQAGFVCAYNKMFGRFDTRKLEDVRDAMASMANMNLDRLQRAMIFEMMDGGMPTGEVSSLIDQNMRLMKDMKDLIAHTPKAIINQRRVINADGSSQTDTTIQGNPTTSSGGILGQLFSQYMDDSDDDSPDEDPDNKMSRQPDNTEDVDYEVVVDEEDIVTPEKPKKKVRKLSRSKK